jgi:hypothetical protein
MCTVLQLQKHPSHSENIFESMKKLPSNNGLEGRDMSKLCNLLSLSTVTQGLKYNTKLPQPSTTHTCYSYPISNLT